MKHYSNNTDHISSSPWALRGPIITANGAQVVHAGCKQRNDNLIKAVLSSCISCRKLFGSSRTDNF